MPPQSQMQKSALVTGVSSGIGRAIAGALIAKGWQVFGSVRKQGDADQAQQTLGPNFTPLLFDVTDAEAVQAAANQVREQLGGTTKLAGLVNNAGIALAGPLEHLPMEAIERSMDVNFYGALRVTKAFLPLLGTDPQRQGPAGKIVNMSSVAGKNANPFMTPYTTSKHALEAMSETLRRELSVHDIDVIIVAPGVVKTPIWEKAKDLDPAYYAGTEYYDALENMQGMAAELAKNGVEPEAVGELVGRIFDNPKPKTRYTIMNNKTMMWTIPNMLPKRMLDGIINKKFGLVPAASKAPKGAIKQGPQSL